MDVWTLLAAGDTMKWIYHNFSCSSSTLSRKSLNVNLYQCQYMMRTLLRMFNSSRIQHGPHQ